MENYDYVRFLGQGSYGEVQLVKHVLEGKEVSYLFLEFVFIPQIKFHM